MFIYLCIFRFILDCFIFLGILNISSATAKNYGYVGSNGKCICPSQGYFMPDSSMIHQSSRVRSISPSMSAPFGGHNNSRVMGNHSLVNQSRSAAGNHSKVMKQSVNCNGNVRIVIIIFSVNL